MRPSTAKEIFFDSSAFFILLSEGHISRSLVLTYIETARKIIITNFIYDETLTLIRMKMGISKSIELQKYLKNNEMVEIEEVTFKDMALADEIFSKYKDKSYSYTDCTSFAFLKKMKVSTVLTTDKHFKQVGVKNLVLLKDK